jgi:L-amino acid N-acyltransferase YncA
VNGAPQRIEQEAAPQPGVLLGAIDREAGDQADGDWKALGGSSPHATRHLSVLDLRGDKGVVADDLSLALSADDEGPQRDNAAMIGAEGLVVRRASRDDCEAMCAIYNAALVERGSTFETERRSADDFGDHVDDARFPLLVGDAGGGVVGWAGLASYSTRPCYAGIGECSVYVAAEARGRGVGSALTEALAVVAESKGFHKMIGKLFTDNAASLRLVERCGFASVGLHRRHGQLDGTWRDVLVVERLLGPAA